MPTCPICKSTALEFHARASDIEYATSDREFDFLRCTTCDVLVINPMLSDRLHEIYPANYYSFSAGEGSSLALRVKSWLDRRYLAAILSTIQGRDLAALDVGGGTGWLLDIVRTCDARVTRTAVVDIDAGAQTRAQAAGHDYHLGRFEEYAGPADFDLVLMLNLIEHVTDPVGVLRKAHTLLSHRGLLVIKTPNFDALDARLFQHQSWAGYHTPRHFVLFTRDSLIKACRNSGFDVVSFSYTQGAPFWSVSILDRLRRAGLVSVSRERPAIYHPLMPVLQIAAAAFDFARKPFANLSQMQVILRKSA